jgi:quercetin dioxygenase-like cupin family protein
MSPYVVEESDVPVEGGMGCTWRTLTSADRTPTALVTCGVCEISPGAALELHRHPKLEVYYFLAGEGVVTLGPVERAVRPGTTICIPADTAHGIRNDGSVTLKLFYVFPVDSFSEVEYTML